MVRPTRRAAAKPVNYNLDDYPLDPALLNDHHHNSNHDDDDDNGEGDYAPEAVIKTDTKIRVERAQSTVNKITLKLPSGYNPNPTTSRYVPDHADVEADANEEDASGEEYHDQDDPMAGARSTRSSARNSGRSSGGSSNHHHPPPGSSSSRPVRTSGRRTRAGHQHEDAHLDEVAMENEEDQAIVYPDVDAQGRSQAQAQSRRPSRSTRTNNLAIGLADETEPNDRGTAEQTEQYYDDQDAEGEVDDEYVEEEEEVEPPAPPAPLEMITTRGGRNVVKKQIIESDSEQEPNEDDFEDSISPDPERPSNRKSTRVSRKPLNGFVEPDDGDLSEDSNGRRKKASSSSNAHRRSTRNLRNQSKPPKKQVKDDDYEAHSDDEDELADELAELRDDTPQFTDHSSDVIPATARPSRGKANGRGRKTLQSTDDEQPTRKLRERTNRPNYGFLPLPPDELPGRSRAGPSGTSGFNAGSQSNGGFLMDMTRGAGALADPNMPNMPDSDSDDEAPDYIKALRKEASSTVALANGGVNRGKKGNAPAVGPSTATVGAGTVGRYNPEAARADADPLGVDLNVTFDQVGGLDGHINQLKEMVALPLLYPELFQQFGITPPRGVLFHGPPGTGKTLLARALAASCSSSSQKIAFFMRKGADCLSKWVGEAERQLRLLFEEAKNAQPSIIFFDEIDGLAPVRSSKQDQVHSSLVATLLALMDGMDGRGQVIVIGATNRPDSVDPALRRPGRFDREFYFPLPNREARKKIISINTRKWQPPLEEPFLNELAGVTKGYGGADLRALCTEAALNAIQRRYPQVYKTNDRLLLDPTSIHVQARDFMASVKKIVPSSARSASSSAQPIPPHLEPLLLAPLQQITGVLDGLIPNKKTKTVLEEAEWEDDNADGTFGKELIMQSFETLRVYRPRLLIHGKKGLGQRFYGAALLHHLEGFHVQNMDIATLLGQSTATTETMLVQMFVEAKRHQPSVLYIPALTQWSAVLTPTARATFGTLLDSLTPSEPVIVIAFMDEPLAALDDEIKSWFGRMGNNLIQLRAPSIDQIKAYFQDIFEKIRLPPDQFPDALPKRRRVLEELPRAAPLPPPAPSALALAEQAVKDQTLKEIVAFRLNPILTELKKRHNRKSTLTAAEALHRWHQLVARDEAQAEAEKEAARSSRLDPEASLALDAAINGEAVQPMVVDGPQPNPFAEETENLPIEITASATPGAMGSTEVAPVERPRSPSPVVNKPSRPRPHWVDFELMQEKLMSQDDGYYSLRTFERDIFRMRENVDGAEMDLDKRSKAALMAKEATLMIKDHFQDEQQKLEIERMAAREYAKKQLSKKKMTKSANSSPNGTRSSARLSGRAPEISFSEIIQNEKANGKKRSRDGSVDSASITSDARAAKRNRAGEFNNVVAPVDEQHILQSATFAASHGSSTGSGTHAMAAPFQADVLAGQLEQASTIAQPSSEGLAAILNPVQSRPRSTTPLAAPVSHYQQPPPLPHPAFFVPERELQTLSDYLVVGTSEGFTIEDLEQLHSMALKIIWTYRSDWDRSGMLHRLVQQCSSFIEMVYRGT